MCRSSSAAAHTSRARLPDGTLLRHLPGGAPQQRGSTLLSAHTPAQQQRNIQAQAVAEPPATVPKGAAAQALKLPQAAHGFELQREEYVDEYGSRIGLYRHTKTGAELMSVSNDDENKTFGAVFRTPVDDATGIPHILEHSVLNGSRKYPVKEPFVELIKGSLNTFINAMTFPDRTCYPVASTNLQVRSHLVLWWRQPRVRRECKLRLCSATCCCVQSCASYRRCCDTVTVCDAVSAACTAGNTATGTVVGVKSCTVTVTDSAGQAQHKSDCVSTVSHLPVRSSAPHLTVKVFCRQLHRRHAECLQVVGAQTALLHICSCRLTHALW